MPIYKIPIQRTMNETVYVEASDLDRAVARACAGETAAEHVESCALPSVRTQ